MAGVVAWFRRPFEDHVGKLASNLQSVRR